MPTIKDIARLANVSHGTVSNVLNKKGIVSAEKIILVENAAKELGFVLNAQAKQLRSSSNNQICVVVPKIDSKRYNDLIVGLSTEAKKYGSKIDIYYTNNVLHYEEELIKTLLSTNPRVIVLVSTTLNNLPFEKTDTEFIFVFKKLDLKNGMSKFFSFDYEKAGFDIAKAITEKKYKQIAIFTTNASLPTNILFANEIKRVLDESKKPYKEFSSSESMGYNLAFDVVGIDNEFDCIITSNQEDAEVFKNIQNTLELKKSDIYSLSSHTISYDNSIYRYELNYKYVGKLIGEYINSIDEDYSEVIFPVTGFSDGLINKIYKKNAEINFLTIQSPTSEAIEKMLPMFTKRTGIKVNMIKLSYDETLNTLNDERTRSHFDVVRMDMVWLTRFFDILKEFNNNDDEYKKILKKTNWMPLEYFYEEGKLVALPLDPSVQMLYYRKDLLFDQLIKREFYEKYKKNLEVPKTYEEYLDVLHFFTRSVNPLSKTKYGSVHTTGNSVVSMNDFVFRLSDSKCSIFDNDGKVLVTKNEIANALDQYKAEHQHLKLPNNNWWSDSAKQFASGEVAFFTTYSNHASTIFKSNNSKVIGKIGYANVPGGRPLLGGGVISVLKSSDKEEYVKSFISWLYEDKVSSIITYLGGFIANECILKNVDILELYPWYEDISNIFQTAWRRGGNCQNKNFDQHLFEKIFGKAVLNTIHDLSSAKKSLEDIQDELNEIFNNQS